MQNITLGKKTGSGRLISLCLALVFALSALFGVTRSAAWAARYTDTASHWSHEAIERWSGYGVLRGVTETQFQPDRAVTRAEFLAMINRAFGATATADIANFRDVPPPSWYFTEIARAVKMGTTNGTSATTMSPSVGITRQEAIVVLARALGVYAEGYTTLQTFKDAYLVAPYARTHVSAFVDHGYISGFDGYINPLSTLSRAEAVTMLDNVFGEIVSESRELASSHSILVRTPGITLSGSVTGDVIIADGVGTGDVTLQNLTISGRLVIRGGGANSVRMTGVNVRGGTFVQNPNGTTRLALTGSSTGSVTARTSVIIDGARASSVIVPPGLTQRVTVTLSGASMDAVNLSSPADVKLISGTVSNVYFQLGADGSTFDIASGAKVESMTINAPDVSVTGSGALADVSINASGVRIAMSPLTYYIGDNLSAVINGVTRYGRATSTTGSNVYRRNTSLYITQDWSQTGGTGLGMSTSTETGYNGVYVSQTSNTVIPLSLRSSRLAYWVGFFIPTPGDGTSAVSVTYDFDGAPTTRNISQTYRNGVRGLELAIPVTRYEDGSAFGALSTSVFINWGAGQYETLWFLSGALELRVPTAAEEATLVGYFTRATFSAYSGTTYTGAEAIRRLLVSDNALGLNVRGFKALAESGMNNIAIRLSGERNLLTTRSAIQERLFIALAGEGAFFAINRATTAEQVKGIIELKDFGYQVGIDDLTMTKYYTLSQMGRLSVARTVLLSRGTDYKTEEELVKVFLAAVDSVRLIEVRLLTDINAVRTREEMQKLLENKANNVLLDIVTDADPYKSFDADKKISVMANIFSKKPFSSLDEVRSLFISLVGSPAVPPSEQDKVLAVTVARPTMTIGIGDTVAIGATVTTASGYDTSNGAVSFAADKTNIAWVDTSGVVHGAAKGTARVTVTSTRDTSKKATVTVNVVEPVPATALALSQSRVDVAAGGEITVRAVLTPSNSTAPLSWNSDKPDIATVSAVGTVATVKGVRPGVTRISVMTKDGLTASCTVVVVGTQLGIAVYPDKVTVGINSSKELIGVVSPITLSERGVIWKSEDTTKVRVDPYGVVTGVSDSEGVGVKVTATSKYDSSLVATCIVTVDPTIRTIVLNKTSMTLYKGAAESITATVFPLGSEDTIIWSSSNRNFVTVVEDAAQNTRAMVTAGTTAGTYKVTASLGNDAEALAECTVTVLSTAVSVTVPATLKMNVREETYLEPKFTPTTIENKAVAWKSDKPDIVKVDAATGRLVAVSAGVAKITGVPEANKEITLTCTVTVTEIPAKSIRLYPATMTLRMGEKRKIEAVVDPTNASNIDKIVWTVPDNAKVSVSPDGYVTGGDVPTWEYKDVYDSQGNWLRQDDVNTPEIVTAMIDGKTATCAVTVSREKFSSVETIEIGLDTWVFPVGFAQNLSLEYNNGNPVPPPADKKVNWSSGDPDIASVDANGYMICKKPGVTTITVITEDNAAKDSKIVVVAPVGLTSLSLSGLSNEYGKGNWINLNLTGGNVATVTATPNSQATNKNLIWASNDTGVVTVSPTGVLTARGPGWAKVTITPVQATRYDSAKPSAANVILESGRGLDIDDYKGAGVYKDPDDGKYYGPNEKLNPDFDPIQPPSTSNPRTIRQELETDILIPLVVKNEITNGSNEFWVFVNPLGGATQHALSFNDAPGKTVGIGEEITLTAQLNWGDSTDVEWEIPTELSIVGAEPAQTTSGKAAITLKGATPGTYTVKVTAKVEEIRGTNNAELQKEQTLVATYTVVVGTKHVDSVTITGEGTGPVYIGETRQLTAVIEPENATDKTVTWSSSDPGKISVTSAGVITAVSPGAATITVKTNDGNKTAAVSLLAAARPAVTGVTLSVTGGTSIPGGTGVEQYASLHLTASVTPANAMPGTVTWTIGTPGIVDIADGIDNLHKTLFGMNVGTTTVTVEVDGKEASCTVTVTQPVVAGSLMIGAKLPDGTTVGNVSGGQTQQAALEGVKLRTSATVVIGKPLTLVPYVTPYNASKTGLKWESSKPDVATVKDGVVTGVKAGSAKITVTDGSGKLKATCTVTVRAKDDRPVTSISVNKKTLAVNVGASGTLSVSYKPSNATRKGVTWTSGDEEIARVEPTGKVIGVSAGKTTITATSDSGAFVATCEVTVSVPVKSVKLSDTALKLKIGESYKLGVTIDPDNASDKTAAWKSSAPSTASVSEDGTVTAKKAGSATITVTVNGKKATCKVTVVK